MNKFRKTALAITSIVMAGTMVFSFAACGGTEDPDDNTDNTDNTDYTLTYDENTEINIAIGYSKVATGAFYSGLTGTTTIPGGYSATSGNIKPAFKAIQDTLGVTFTDSWDGSSTSANLTTLKTNNSWGTTTDIATTDLSVAVSSYNTNDDILNLADYLDYMPNFKAFLEANPVVYLSLLQDGMSTSDGSDKTILVAPYFDGNDDIERYCLIRQDWVEDLLDSDLSTLETGTAYSTSVATSTSVSGGWMGTTSSYTVETSTEADGGETTFNLKKDYSAALNAAKDASTDLGAAYYAIANKAYAGDSGNIVDIMNAAIEANNGATGKQLVTLYRAYIDKAYTNADTGAAAYSKRSDLFNGYSAAWDVDDLVAMLRIVKCNAVNVGLSADTAITGIFPREANNDRTPDIIRLAAQLYGERGADSRYEYTYIDQSGNLQDARNNVSFYEALDAFGELASEGLVANYVTGSVSGTSLKGDCKTTAGTGFMMYDYSQTQTTQMFDLASDSVDADYLFAAISTPVSKWDVNGDSTDGKEVTMRFTESWRSTKTSGLCVAASVKNDKNLLNAVLAFIDYIYSNDGQIVSTFGMQDTTANSENPNGTWYGNEVSNYTVTEDSITIGGKTVATLVGGQMVVTDEYSSQYFCFNNKLYTGTLYKGRMTPTITDELYASFTATDGVNAVSGLGSRGSFTTYARQVLGATLPMGVKDQSFENQLTAKQAATEATKVSASLNNGTIKHVTLTIDTNNYWYTCVPTGLPLDVDSQENIDATSQNNLKYMTGTKSGDSKDFYSIFHHIIWYGYTGEYKQNSVTLTLSCGDASGFVSMLQTTYGLTTRVSANNSGWQMAKSYWTYLSANI